MEYNLRTNQENRSDVIDDLAELLDTDGDIDVNREELAAQLEEASLSTLRSFRDGIAGLREELDGVDLEGTGLTANNDLTEEVSSGVFDTTRQGVRANTNDVDDLTEEVNSGVFE